MERHQTIKSRVNRLRVFSALKTWMEEFGYCPTSAEVSEDLGDLSQQTCHKHMRALQSADGLPCEVVLKQGVHRSHDSSYYGQLNIKPVTALIK